jgi:hypothetical protein
MPWRDERGAAYVEFLLAFIPLFVMFLGMVQMALMYAGDLVVQHAATTASRAAAVVLDDDPARYDGAARMRVDAPASSGSGEGLGGLGRIFGGEGGGGSASEPAPGGPRVDAIRRAASIPLVAISPSMDQLVDADSVRTAIGSPEGRGATGLFMYNDAAMAVTFPSAPGASSYRDGFEPGDQALTRVTYLFHCAVPLVSRMMCETYGSLRLGPAAALVEGIVRDLSDGTITLEQATERLRRADESRRRHERDEPAIDELDAAGASDMLYLTWATGARFKVMRGEASMPVQYARYEYR